MGSVHFEPGDLLRIGRIGRRATARQFYLLGTDRNRNDGPGDGLARLRDHDGVTVAGRNRQAMLLMRGDLALEQIDVADELGDPARGGPPLKVARGPGPFEPAG